MEDILKKLQEIHIEAFRRKLPTFYITTYHWDDTPESPDMIVVRASKTDEDEDVFYARFHPEDAPEVAEGLVHELKLYLGL